jgi:hypothetical protein
MRWRRASISRSATRRGATRRPGAARLRGNAIAFWAGGTDSHDEVVIPVDRRRAYLGSAGWIIRSGVRRCGDRAGPCRCAHGPVVASQSEHAPPLGPGAHISTQLPDPKQQSRASHHRPAPETPRRRSAPALHRDDHWDWLPLRRRMRSGCGRVQTGAEGIFGALTPVTADRATRYDADAPAPLTLENGGLPLPTARGMGRPFGRELSGMRR